MKEEKENYGEKQRELLIDNQNKRKEQKVEKGKTAQTFTLKFKASLKYRINFV